MLAPPQSASIIHVQGSPLAIARWLFAVAALIVIMVIVGGITRLTESGLSITEWKPITGALPPLSDTAWQAELDLYRRTTEYQTVNRGMSMAEFQFIYFWEWAHRLLGRVIGLAFALPLAWFAWKRAIPTGYGRRLIVLLALGGLQGVVGWWMVASGLTGRTDVSHYRLAVHLNLALFILGALVWTARDMLLLHRMGRAPALSLRPAVIVALAILGLQLVWGAFVAGLNAGYAFDSWPLMGDEIFPAAAPLTGGLLASAVDNPILVQFIHRWWAFVAAGAMIWLGIAAMRSGERRIGIALHALVVTQVVLGIATLVSGMAFSIALSHQAVAALLVAAAAWSAHAASTARHTA
jgi:heme a synthase